jgi:hypothetical protein
VLEYTGIVKNTPYTHKESYAAYVDPVL